MGFRGSGPRPPCKILQAGELNRVEDVTTTQSGRWSSSWRRTKTMGWLPVTAVRLNELGVFLHLQGEPVHVGEDSVRRGGGRRAQSAVRFRPCQGGQLTTKVIAGMPKEYNLHPATDLVLCRGLNPHPVLPGYRSAESDLTENSVTSSGDGGVDTDGFTNPRDERTVNGGGGAGGFALSLTPSPYIHTAWEFIWWNGLWSFFYVLFFMWAHSLRSCMCRGLILNPLQVRAYEILSVQAFFSFWKWYCLPSVVSYTHYFSKVFPETEGML